MRNDRGKEEMTVMMMIIKIIIRVTGGYMRRWRPSVPGCWDLPPR